MTIVRSYVKHDKTGVVLTDPVRTSLDSDADVLTWVRILLSNGATRIDISKTGAFEAPR